MYKRRDFKIVEKEGRYVVVRVVDSKESVPFRNREDARYVLNQILKGLIKPE